MGEGMGSMTVYVDEIREYPKKWCHMWCDGNLDELHAMADQIGLKRGWFQTKRFDFLHYDLVPSKRSLALKRGAEFMPLKDWLSKQKGKVMTDSKGEAIEQVFKEALIALWRSSIAGEVYILQRPDGTYFHSVEWSYLPSPYQTAEDYLGDKFPGCVIVYIGDTVSRSAGRGTQGFEGFVNDWSAELPYRLADSSYVYRHEEPL